MRKRVLFAWLWRKTKMLWQLAKSERATPREIGWAFAVGVFVGCSPVLGFHTVVTLAAASLFRLNRLFAWIGSRMSNALVLPFIIVAEIQIAHRLRTGEWAGLDWRHFDLEHPLQQVGPLLLDWILGTPLVGGILAAIFGLSAWRVALWRDRRRTGTIP